MSKKKLIFKKGISKIRFPFMLNSFSPWQEQVKEEIQSIAGCFLPRKNVEWGFEITNRGAEINVTKTK